MKKRAIALSIILPIAAIAAIGGSAAAEGRFFLRAGAGAGIPSLNNLESELALQEYGEELAPGLSIAVSLGRSFAEEAWSLELYIAGAVYRDFLYGNDYEGFAANLRHYDFMGVLRRHWRAEAKWFRPSLGIGAGYGSTELISGGGKMGAMQGIGALRVESALRENLFLAVECAYSFGLQTKAFDAPFIENVESDAVYTSDHEPLEDRYDCLEIRIGITVRLPKTLQE